MALGPYHRNRQNEPNAKESVFSLNLPDIVYSGGTVTKQKKKKKSRPAAQHKNDELSPQLQLPSEGAASAALSWAIAYVQQSCKTVTQTPQRQSYTPTPQPSLLVSYIR